MGEPQEQTYHSSDYKNGMVGMARMQGKVSGYLMGVTYPHHAAHKDPYNQVIFRFETQ